MSITLIKAASATIALAAGLFLAQASIATPYTVTPTSGANVFGTPKWSQTATIFRNGGYNTVSAGMFRLTLNDDVNTPVNIDTFCIELDQYLSLPATYEEATLDPALVESVNALWSNAFPLIDGGTTAAAFQFSLWELTHDTGFNLSSGALQISGKRSTELLAQRWLDNIKTGAWVADPSVLVTALVSETSQDQLWARSAPPAPVPLPATALLLASGWSLLAFARKRRRTIS